MFSRPLQPGAVSRSCEAINARKLIFAKPASIAARMSAECDVSGVAALSGAPFEGGQGGKGMWRGVRKCGICRH
jgi:hypothetical protein